MPFFLFWLPFAILLLINRIPNPTYLWNQTDGSCTWGLHCNLHSRTGIWDVQAQCNRLQASQPERTPYVTELFSEFKVGPACLHRQLRRHISRAYGYSGPSGANLVFWLVFRRVENTNLVFGLVFRRVENTSGVLVRSDITCLQFCNYGTWFNRRSSNY